MTPRPSSSLPPAAALRLCDWHKDGSYWLNVTAGGVEGEGAPFHTRQPPLLTNELGPHVHSFCTLTWHLHTSLRCWKVTLTGLLPLGRLALK